MELLTNNVTPEEFIQSQAWRRKSREVRAKYKHECQACLERGQYARAVLVHHDKPSRTHPELRLSDTWTDKEGVEHPQLIPLCHRCHEEIEEARGNRPGGAEPTGLVTPERWG